MIWRMLLTVVLGISSVAGSAMARTSAEEFACRRDAVHFCRGVSEEFQVRDCLVAQKGRLSRNCRAVLESHGL